MSPFSECNLTASRLPAGLVPDEKTPSTNRIINVIPALRLGMATSQWLTCGRHEVDL